MLEKVFLLSFMVALCAWHTTASLYLPCSNEQNCKFSMKHEFSMLYTQWLKRTLIDVSHVPENLAKTLKSEYPANEPEKLTQILARIQAQREFLNSHDPTVLMKLDEVRNVIYETWMELKQMLPEGFNLDTYTQRIREIVDQKDFLEFWNDAAHLRNNVEIAGFQEIDQEVQRLKDLPFNAENKKAFIDLHARILKFFEMENLIPKHHA